MDSSEVHSKNKNYVYKLLIIILVCTTGILSVYCLSAGKAAGLYRDKYNNESVSAMMILKSNQTLANDSNTAKNQSEKLSRENVDLKKENEQIKKQIDLLKKQKKQLETAKNELASDNLELQKSLKKAAAVGVTPQSYKIYNGDTLESDYKKGKYLGKFLGTAYTPSSDECGNDMGITSSGQPIVPGVSIAVDKKHWPYGTVFYIKGLGYTVAMDTGSAIKGAKRFDFAVLDKNFAYELGEQYYDVYLVKLGNGKIDESILS